MRTVLSAILLALCVATSASAQGIIGGGVISGGGGNLPARLQPSLWLDASRVYQDGTMAIHTSASAVPVGTYPAIATGAANFGAATSSAEYLFKAQDGRIRQWGTVKGIQMYCPIAANLTGFALKVWRRNGDGTYALVGSSEDVIAQWSAGNTVTMTFASPITGVQEGDYWGYRETTSGAGATVRSIGTSAATDRACYFIANTDAASGSAYAWETKTNAGGYLVPIKLLMDTPKVVFIGDSICQGVPNNYAFTQTDKDTTNLETYWGHRIARSLGWTYQNMGHGSDTTTQMAARFATDVVAIDPDYVVIEGGINDILGTDTPATVLANYATMAEAAQAAGIVPILVGCPPDNATTTLRAQYVDTVNAGLPAIATAAGGISVAADVTEALGQFRADGDAGNLWDINTAYAADNYHFNAYGSMALAQAVLDGIEAAGYGSRAVPAEARLAADLNGSNQYFSMADSATLRGNGGDWEVGAWIKLDSVPASTTVVSKWQTTTGNKLSWILGISGSHFQFNISETGADFNEVAQAANVLSEDVWYFVRGWYDDSEKRIYCQVNGGTAASTEVDADIYEGEGTIAVGYNATFSANYLNGKLDKVYCKNAITSDADVTWFYNTGAGRTKYEMMQSGMWASMQAYWEFELASITLDLSPNGNKLTNNNAVTATTGVDYATGGATAVSTISEVLDRANGVHSGGNFDESERPNYLALISNERPSIYGDGATDLDIAATTATGAFTAYAIVQAQGTIAAYTVLGDSTGDNYIQLKDNTTIAVKIAGGTAVDFTVDAMGNTVHELCVTRDASNLVRVYVDGIESTTDETEITGTLAIYRLLSHGTEYFVGHVQNAIVYDKLLSAGEQASMHSVLQSTY